MKKPLPRIVSAEAVVHGVLKIVWTDGYAGVVDLRPTIDRGKVFKYLQDPENFKRFTLEDYGHSIGWTDDEGNKIDFGADSLREKSENQAKLHKIIAELRT